MKEEAKRFDLIGVTLTNNEFILDFLNFNTGNL